MPMIKTTAVLALALVAASCSCGRKAPVDAETVAAAPGATPVAASAGAAPAATEPAAASLAAREATAMRGAVDVVQRYLARLGGADWAAADAEWAYRRQPAPSEEAGLRALLPARSMRIQTGRPRALDDEAVPAFVEVPVTLRVDTASDGAQRYDGWYRVRWNPVQREWELVAASVKPAIR